MPLGEGEDGEQTSERGEEEGRWSSEMSEWQDEEGDRVSGY